MSGRAVLVAAAGAGVGYAALQWLGHAYGSTRAERRRPLPGDDLCARPQIVTTHASTIAAPPERVWPWLVQMGWGRGQWYTARWVDRLFFPANGPSADAIVPEWQHLAVGDRILDGPPEARCAFVVAGLVPERHLVLHSREHLPPGWAERFGAAIDWSWAFVLEPGGDGTRLLFRTRVRLRPWWVAAAYRAFVVPADFVMSRQMLRGVRARAERTTGASWPEARRPIMPMPQKGRRWLYRGRRPHALARVLNRGQAVLAARGIGPRRVVVLEVTGRRTGRTVALPVVVAEHRGERYLVSMLGEDTHWVRNVRASGGRAVLRHGGAEAVLLEEVPVADRAAVLRRYVELAPGARAHIGLDPRAPLADFARVAPRYPVFRITVPAAAADRAPAVAASPSRPARRAR